MRLNKKSALIEVTRRSACSGDCNNCSGCDERHMQISAYCDIPVKAGDIVRIESEERPVLLGLFVIFVLPMILPVAVYLLTMKSGIGGWLAAIAVVVALALIFFLSKSKWYLKKTQPRIICIISEKR